ncbi:Hypothetical predicted protein [Pelobates cultripes]|uniref:Uncharacterized protein n=1 Tax=Pelobates cultripes TaxID=61616 RepID=A0AAD1R1A9_PELCU|nr:Hypothetical predicted protein [Pelobates cultripes]
MADLREIEPIADNILVVGCEDKDGDAEQDHDGKLLELIILCRQVTIRLGLKKLQFKVKKVCIHILSWKGLKQSKNDMKDILEAGKITNE